MAHSAVYSPSLATTGIDINAVFLSALYIPAQLTAFYQDIDEFLY